MLKTLALRDHMTARHSAAVARYARALAREAGCSAEEQDLVHTAGLLHDIGKFIFPDRILLANTQASATRTGRSSKCHPYQGAKIVRQVEGYGPVADIILGHHERVDGKGYPRGLQRGPDPAAVAHDLDRRHLRRDDRARLLPQAGLRAPRRSPSCAASPARSSTRTSSRLFVAMVERGDLVFRHGDDADFDAELDFERRVTEYAAPRKAARGVAFAA